MIKTAKVLDESACAVHNAQHLRVFAVFKKGGETMAVMTRRNSTPDESGLRPRHIEMLQVLAAWSGPEPPLNAALASHMGLAGESSVRDRLSFLIENGFVERYDIGPAKLPRVTDKGRAALGVQIAPKVLPITNTRLADPVPVYPISCGPLSEASTEPSSMLFYLGDIFQNFRDGDYLLIAEGNSMVADDRGESIFPGDRCLVRPDVWPGNGETVHAEYVLDNGVRECTLKDFFYNESTGLVTLRARNDNYPEIVRSVEDIEIRGVVLEIVHSVRKKGRKK